MNPIGINLWNWTGDFNQTKIQYIEKAAKLGYTAVEIGVENAMMDSRPIKEIIENNHLQVTLCAAMTKGKDISSFDKQVRENTKEYMKKCFLLGKEIGSKLFVGPVYAGGGKAHLLSWEDKRKEWELAVTGLREMAEVAAECGMSIAIEPLNRYRTSVVNTLDQALQMVDDINKDNVGILYDTYQANIEEKDIYEPLKTICKAGKLLHVQLSDSNRGAPGMGHIDFKPVFEILNTYDYKGHITVETFTEGVFDSGWIVLDTPDNVAKIGIETIKGYI
ncbi:sugar phosphate isomerase/epimerase family protein [Anaerocolumna sp.]|uniref:sugar phosphate isomerase/epimerase family protein n=1 Tax=Anaerocolumna sp. TaxID=2041569 RepID=UPI0028B06084|nr:sugar phosphate isomerase/epimerase family protein [Anaerocolumna sp.]